MSNQTIEMPGQGTNEALMDAVFAVLGADTLQPMGHNQPRPSSAFEEEVPWVLCIDDDVDFSNALKYWLEDHGVAVSRAYNGMEGYFRAFTWPASAILLDYCMPNGRGDYILSRLKDNPVTKRIPVLIITSVRNESLKRQMLAAGAAEFLTKPVSFRDLQNCLSQYIDILASKPCETSTARNSKFDGFGNGERA
jgi:CheY-like chemotaxis protein